MTPATNFAALLTRYFTQRLVQQRSASPHTIRSYRDTFHLLLLFACVFRSIVIANSGRS